MYSMASVDNRASVVNLSLFYSSSYQNVQRRFQEDKGYQTDA